MAPVSGSCHTASLAPVVFKIIHSFIQAHHPFFVHHHHFGGHVCMVLVYAAVDSEPQGPAPQTEPMERRGPVGVQAPNSLHPQ